MPGPPVRHRKRLFHAGFSYSEPVHAHPVEFCIEIALILACFMFIVGSYCFYSDMPEHVTKVGDLMFIVASAIYVVTGVHAMHEMRLADGVKAVTTSEYMENLSYVISAIIFSIGTVLFLPDIYKKLDMTDWKEMGEIAAAWCFILGSAGFVFAAFLSAVSLSHERTQKDLWSLSIANLVHKLDIFGLFCSLFGGVFFLMGSYLYRPGFGNAHCEGYEQDSTGRSELCVDILDAGTNLYVVGSYLYTVQSGINIWKLTLKLAVKDRLAIIEKEGFDPRESDLETDDFDEED